MIAKLKQQLIQNKHRLIIMKLSSLLVVVNFFTTITIVKHLGFSSELDIFYISMTVFYFLLSSISWSISSVLTPMLIKNQGEDIAGKMFTNVALIIIPITIITLLSMFLWSKLLFVNYLNEVPLKDILVIQSIFIVTFCIDGLSLTYISIFQKMNRYITINLLTLAASIIGFVTVYSLIDTLGVYIAAGNQLLIKLIIFIAMSVILLPKIHKTIKFDKAQFIHLWNKAKYMLIGSLYYKGDEISERFIASYLTGGFVSLVAFIQRVYGAFITVINSAIGVPSITVFSNLVKIKDYRLIRKTLWKYILSLLAIDTLIFISIIFSGKLLILYLLDGTIADELLPILPLAILLLFSMVFGKTIGQVLQSLLLSMGKEKIVTIYESTTFTINLAIKIILTIFYGMEGLLISIMLSTLITDGAKMYLIHKELNKLGV